VGSTNVLRAIACAGIAAVLLFAAGSAMHVDRYEPLQPGGDPRVKRAPSPEELRPGVEAAFEDESYAPGSSAKLRFFADADAVGLQVFHVGPERIRTVGSSEMQGVPVSREVEIGDATAGQTIPVAVGQWPSGLYFARLDASDGEVGFAPFVVGPGRLGTNRVAVVMPTFTWQAYNIRDDDGDGVGNSWYANRFDNVVRLGRPFLNRGVPFRFREYDLRFLHWLARHHEHVDVLTDGSLDRVPSAKALARAYDLVVFPGHDEYVTEHEYDVVEGYRDLGGSLAFLSADNFYWRVVRRGNAIVRTRAWRSLGRPEAGLIGVQYRASMPRFGRYVVVGAGSAPWLFAGTGLENGSRFGHGGIEIDSVDASSPPNVKLLARIPDVFGSGIDADMTLYRTNSGGTVFAAGAFTLAASSVRPEVSRMLENLWRRATNRL
jgi:hypothetical protein